MKGGGEALADGARAIPADGEQQLVATPADGALHLAVRQVVGALLVKAGELPRRTKGGREKKRDLLLFLLVALRAALLLHYLHLTPREPTFVPGTISGTNISYSVIRDREFLTLMLNTASNEEEEEEAADAAAVEAPPVPEEDLDAVRARYMRTSGFRADDAL
ncbi:unnamed protein product [Closterium sp. NIES-53]